MDNSKYYVNKKENCSDWYIRYYRGHSAQPAGSRRIRRAGRRIVLGMCLDIIRRIYTEALGETYLMTGRHNEWKWIASSPSLQEREGEDCHESMGTLPPISCSKLQSRCGRVKYACIPKPRRVLGLMRDIIHHGNAHDALELIARRRAASKSQHVAPEQFCNHI